MRCKFPARGGRCNRLHDVLAAVSQGGRRPTGSLAPERQIFLVRFRGAVNSLLVEIVEGEIRFHVLGKNARVDSREAKAAENLVEILHRYIK